MTEGQAITFDGFDVYKGKPYLATPLISVWESYNPRQKIVGVVQHGASGILLEQKGKRCKVRISGNNGPVEGYLTFWFIKELKESWLASRRKGQA